MFFENQDLTGNFNDITNFYFEEEEDKFLDEISFTENGKTKTLRTVAHFEKKLYRKLKIGFSPTVIIIGQQGIGKSFVALYYALQHSKLFQKDFDFRNNSFYEVLKVMKALEFKFKEPLLIDEAGDLLNVKEWYEKTHIAINSMINTQRYRQNLYLFISPFISDLDTSIIKHFDFQIHVTAHGRFKTFKFFKRYAERETKKASFPIFLDDCGIKLSQIPPEIFADYTLFSNQEKEKIRQKRVKQIETQDKKNEYIYQYIKGLKGRYD